MTILCIKSFSVNLDKPKASKKTKRVIQMKCDVCGVEFEKKYQRNNLRDDITCSQVCAAKRREARLSPEKKEARRNKKSIIQTQKNIQYWASLSDTERSNLKKRIAKGTVEGMANMSEEDKAKLNMAISAGSKKNWALNHDSIVEKWRKTMSKRGTHPVSKPERLLKEKLIRLLGDDDIETQKIVNGHRIDIFIKSLNTYIQVDGTYWHGYGTTVEKLLSTGLRRDKRRANAIIFDERQTSWFKLNGFRLLRVSDAWVLNATDDDIMSVVLLKHGALI